MRHKDVRSIEEIPARTFRVTFRGEELFVESKGRDALARIPKDDARGWKVICEWETGGSYVAYDGNEVWARRRAA